LAGQSNEQNPTCNIEEKAQPEERGLGRIYPESTMVILNKYLNPNWGTPFSVTYGTEAVIPSEVGSPSFRASYYNPGLNDEGINLHLDLLPEK
jgi:hypothetical protein